MRRGPARCMVPGRLLPGGLHRHGFVDRFNGAGRIATMRGPSSFPSLDLVVEAAPRDALRLCPRPAGWPKSYGYIKGLNPNPEG
jgi:hypothetical protein